ncbi:MAG: M64 family metallo-endopeptidase [Actinomycetota bacterium]|nr:M64 family metallo-endopeptidase [Actinomycetota bacterium]
MGVGDGWVGSTTKVVDHGPDNLRWNLTIVGDGYQAGELATYHDDVLDFVDTISQTPPWDELWCGVNVHRVDVVSTDSGADDPVDPACPSGTGATPSTYFDSTFCSWWGAVRLERLLTVDQTLALNTAQAAVPATHQVLVIVNSSKYGGAGGTVATCSTDTSSAAIAIHEIGHSAFGLADEYEDGALPPLAGEPLEPNVTISTTATGKWDDLIDPGTPTPSSCYADCPNCTPPASPPAAGAVGTYEGAYYRHCDTFRPLPSCYMRDYGPFCPVCARVIRDTLQPFQPPETITLTTPSIDFGDVPEGLGGIGVTHYRAVVWEVAACRDLTFQIVSGPTGGFGTPLGTQDTASPGVYLSVEKARIWLSYTSTTAGSPDANGSVTVECVETGDDWVIPIHARTVPRPKSEVVMVLDRSGSMAEEAGDGTLKVDKLREAAGVFIEAMLEGDGIGLVRFDDTVQRLMDVTDVGPLAGGAGRTAAIGHIEGPELDPAGATSIGGGVVEGKATLDDGQAAASPPYDVQAMVVLTDGIENTDPMLDDVTSSITANTFAVGLGMPYNISVEALDKLAQGTGGFLRITGALTTEQQTLLTKYFLQILAGITNAEVAVDPGGTIGPSETHRIPFTVSEPDYGLDAYVLTPAPAALKVTLELPDGSAVTPTRIANLGTGKYVRRDAVGFYRLSLPAVPADPAASHDGQWHVVLQFDRRRAQQFVEKGTTLDYDVMVHCYSNLVFDASSAQTSYEPGAEVRMFASLREYEVPVEDRASVWAEVRRPDGTEFDVPLAPAGGQYAGAFATTLGGAYQMRVRAQGETFHGSPFTRERTLTAVAVPGGGRPGGRPDPIVELLCCLLEHGAFKGDRGEVDPRVLEGCLKRLCAERPASLERRATRKDG